MSAIRIAGWGAVSPAGWSVAAFRDAMARGERVPPGKLQGAPANEAQAIRVPPAQLRPAFLSHARLRRSSAITQYTVSAGLEALGAVPGETGQVGVVVCVFSGCVSYSRRFYGETLQDPATASPLVFPETVFNAPASHLSAYLGSTAINYTMVGDAGTYLLGLALAAQWLTEGRVERCLVIGAEEVDWLTADALRLFDRKTPASEGAGALLLETTVANPAPGEILLERITDELSYAALGKKGALAAVRQQLGPAGEQAILCDAAGASSETSRAESTLWQDWKGARFSPKQLFGEGLMALAAWECVLAADALRHGAAPEAFISVSGLHQHALGAKFARCA